MEWTEAKENEEQPEWYNFYPCKRYEGTRVGWVYKTGQAGLGYYVDGAPEPKPLDLNGLLWPTAGLSPVELKLDELITVKATVGNPVQATTEDEPMKKTKGARKHGKQATRGKKGIDVVQAYVDSSMVNGSDKSHRAKGWWAFDTANPNALNGATEYLATTGADFVAAQETKVEEADVKEKEQAIKGKGWRAAISPCIRGSGGGKSSGVAVACRNHVGMAESFDDAELPAVLKGRFSVKHIGAVCKGGIHFASGYLWCSIGLKHAKNQDYLQAVAGVLRTLRGPWIFAADFQNTPEELEATGWLKLVGGKIVAPTVPTCGKRVIVFFVVSQDLPEAIMGIKAVG